VKCDKNAGENSADGERPPDNCLAPDVADRIGAPQHLRVLIANERKDRLALVAPLLADLGHEVITREIDVADVGAVTARERPDVALVGLGESFDHALGLIDKIVQEATCPVDRPAPRARSCLPQGGVQAVRLRLLSDADANDWQKLDRHCAAPLCRVPRP
jgi:hypothetical protein